MFTLCGALDSLEVFLVYLVSWSCGLRSTYSTVQYSAVQYSGVPQYSTVQYSGVPQYSTVQCSAVPQSSTLQNSTVQCHRSVHYILQDSRTVENCAVSYCAVIHCAVLCCIFIVHYDSWKIVGRWGVKSESTENSPPQYHISSYLVD